MGMIFDDYMIKYGHEADLNKMCDCCEWRNNCLNASKCEANEWIKWSER